jgi:F0F1-type ATP synthase epsilon subunit
VLVEEAITPEALDRATIESKLAEARAALERAEEGTEQRARAERDVARYEAFLSVGR